MCSEVAADSIAAKKRVSGYWSLFSSAERYLKNVFKYNIFLNKCTNSFPYEPKKLNKWFTKDVSRVKSEPPVKIPFYNAMNINDARSAINKKIRESASNGLECWFHGTNHQSAVDIVNKGISLKKGAKKLDFSNNDGFYLNPEGMSAVEWVKSKKDASVIIFKVSRQMQNDHRLLNLRGDQERWKKVVKWNRSGEDQMEYLDEELREQFEKCDYIRGPMAGDKTRYNGPNWEPQVKDSQQICVKSRKMANEIGYPDNILGVVSWNN